LREASGLTQLRRELGVRFAERADALKADWALNVLDKISAGQPSLDGLRGRLEEIGLDPELHRLAELRALQLAMRKEAALPPYLLADLERLVGNEAVMDRLGVRPGTTRRELQQVASDGSRRWAIYANSGQASPTGRRIADVARRSYDLTWRSLGETPVGAKASAKVAR
jgi:hypothetical protein